MNSNDTRQLRHAARCSRLSAVRGGGRLRILDLERELGDLGHDGRVGGLTAGDIIAACKKNGWIEISPDGWELRVSDAGKEQFAKWEEEDQLWEKGTSDRIALPKRLKAGEPALNLRKIAQLIASDIVSCVHDPYTDAKSLETLHKLHELGVGISKSLRILSTPRKRPSALLSAKSFLQDLNTDMSSQWELRVYTGAVNPHRRFLVLDNKAIVTCGLSLNQIDKDEVIDRIPAADLTADHDRKLFNHLWQAGSPA